MDSSCVIFTGSSHPELGNLIYSQFVEVGKSTVRRFADGEIGVNIEQSVRNKRVFLVQPTSPPVNDSLMELLITLDAFRRASAKEVNLIIPYYGYARQDKKVKPREPITAKLVAKLIESTNIVKRIVTVDLHSPQIQGFFEIPVDHLYGGPIIANHLYGRNFHYKDLVVVAPDVSSVGRARTLADVLKCPIAIISKRRPEANKVEIMEIVGDVHGKVCVMIDDMIDTGGSIIGGANALMHQGASEVYVAATHGLFSGDAPKKFTEADHITEVICLNTTPITPDKKFDKLRVLDVAPMLSEAMTRIVTNQSISEMFN